ncbi:MAG: hypothetical protein AVO38_13335 [delta proteobacterium ML8_D]|nr:MAG: hypothetical protein AVO38_13335 [delta proteobacterium ML8_D]
MKKFSMLILSLVVLGLTACGAKYPLPSSKLNMATSAINQAEDAGAYDSAPVELKAARENLEQARQAVNRKDNLTAERLAEKAIVDANLAQAKARTAKSQKAVEEIRESIRILQEEIDRKSVQ